MADLNRGIGHDEESSTAAGLFNETVSVNFVNLSAAAAQNSNLGVTGLVINASGTGSADAQRVSTVGASAAHLGRSVFDTTFTVGSASYSLTGLLNITGTFSSALALLEEIGGSALLDQTIAGAFNSSGVLAPGDYHLRLVAEVFKPEDFAAFTGHSDWSLALSVTDTAPAAVPVSGTLWNVLAVLCALLAMRHLRRTLTARV